VPIYLSTQKALRSIQRLPFCYLCGQDLAGTARSERNHDHVPPSTIFSKEDRTPPLKLPTHRLCNTLQSNEDEVIGQLVSLRHSRLRASKHGRLKIAVYEASDGSSTATLAGIDLRAVIRRWVRGFHAALYREYLPDDGEPDFATVPPFPEGRASESGPVAFETPPAVQAFVTALRGNRITRTLDGILCYNQRCRYECVWDQSDNGRWICIYGLDLYDWLNLGDIHNFQARGCVGCYRRPGGGTPRGATIATRLIFPIPRGSGLDPFQE
jgi:hypothetical protein